MKTAAEIDPALAAVFASPTPVYVPNTSFYMSNDTESQFALAVTGGYRGRFALPAGVSSGGASGGNQALEGLYVGANYHYLHGFGYEHFEPDARLDTNAQGLLFVNLAEGRPRHDRTEPRRRAGEDSPSTRALPPSSTDGNWGSVSTASATGSTGRTWSERTTCSTASLQAASSSTCRPSRSADVRVELPVDVRVNGAYNADRWTAITEFGHGYNGTTFRAGFEQRFDRYPAARSAAGTSRSGGRQPAAPASISPIASASMWACSARARTSNGSATSPWPSLSDSCTAPRPRKAGAPNLRCPGV